MGINGINNGQVSWAQFVTATQAARQRNTALTANAPAANANAANTNSIAPKANPVMTPKTANNVYSIYGRVNAQQELSVEVKNRPVGGMFDAYA